MKADPKLKFALFAGLLVAACGAVAYLMTQSASSADSHGWQHDQAHGHDWLREEIGLTDAEFAAINAFEEPYRRERAALMTDYAAQMAKIRDLLVSQDAFSPEVQHAIHELHLVHGQLQELSIRHYFDMLSVLPPEKQAALRRVAVDALSQPE